MTNNGNDHGPLLASLVTDVSLNPRRRPMPAMAKLWIATLESALIDLDLPQNRTNIGTPGRPGPLRLAVDWPTIPERRELDPNGYSLLARPLTLEGITAGINAAVGHEAVTSEGIRRMYKDKIRLARTRITQFERYYNAKIIPIDIRKRELLESAPAPK